MPTKTKIKKNINIEDAFNQLSNIVNEIEKDNISLEDTMKLFEEGVKLTESLRNHLESAEQRIKVLMKDTEGNLKTEDFKD